MEKHITFDNLPKLVLSLCSKIESLEKAILNNEVGTENKDIWFDLNELIQYDPEKRSKQTFYGYVSKCEIPFHKRGKKLIFLKAEIDEWLRSGRKLTQQEIEQKINNK